MQAKQLFAKARKEKRTMLTPDEAFELLRSYKIPVAGYALVQTADDAVKAAEKLGYPVVLKVVSKKVTHKTDVGGVLLDVDSPEALRAGFDRMLARLKKAGVRPDAVLVQAMAASGQQVIVGGRKDPQFGQTVMFGAGGVYVELMDDVAVHVAPVTKADAEAMMAETKMYKALKGFRGRSYDTDAVADIVAKVSKLLTDNADIAEMDINPLVVFEGKGGAVAVDARIVLE
ncbi:MAG: acetate--CoA ligase family protein [Candidatus Aenigmarchaeota archaeon]|nr:acetate--CoA ligase family protein [Candidatus Aenigmarchaeota archaeon]